MIVSYDFTLDSDMLNLAGQLNFKRSYWKTSILLGDIPSA